MHILYYAKGTVALASHIALEESGAEYEARLLDFSKQQQSDEEYLKINSKARVPALITPEGILTESCAILGYIAQKWPEANLAPTSPFEFGEAQAFNNYIASTVHVAHAHKLRGIRWSDDPSAHDSMKAKVTQNMTDCAALIEKEFIKGTYVLGEDFSICDPYLFLATRFMQGDGVNMSDFPAITAHHEMMLARPAVVAVCKLHA